MLAKVLLATLIAVVSAGKLQRNPEFDFGPAPPYQFGYKVQDTNGDQWRTEESDGSGRVTGTYGYVDPNGIQRQVNYIADDNGFRVKVRSNEPGMQAHSPSDVGHQSKGMNFQRGLGDGVSFYSFNHQRAPAADFILPASRSGKQTPWFPMDTVATSP